MIHALKGKRPDAGRSLFVAWNAEVCGEVSLAEDTSVWFGATVRGDLAPIRVGRGSNVQDGVVIHVGGGAPASIGEHVTLGHGAVVHGAVVGDRCIVGIGAIILNGAVVGAGSIVGAGALVTEGKRFPAGSLIIGSPARVVRSLSPEELERIRATADRYIEAARAARDELGPGV